MRWRGFGFGHHSRTIFCRAVPNPNLAIRNFFIAVGGAAAEKAAEAKAAGRQLPPSKRPLPRDDVMDAYLLHALQVRHPAPATLLADPVSATLLADPRRDPARSCSTC